jgi:uncharacterized protein YdeI (YjbR/CyaY-like superfamily)
MKLVKPVFFESPSAFREWLARHHDSVLEAWIGFHKKAAGRKSVTYSEALDEALCFGWIDGVRRTLDEKRWTIRFTPRKPRSTWSLVNIRRAAALKKKGRMAPAGLKAFDTRDRARSGIYSFEQRAALRLDAAAEKKFRARRKAWSFFQAQPPGYRKTATFWVMSAKKEETRARRLDQLIGDSGNGRRIGLLARPQKKGP